MSDFPKQELARCVIIWSTSFDDSDQMTRITRWHWSAYNTDDEIRGFETRQHAVNSAIEHGYAVLGEEWMDIE